MLGHFIATIAGLAAMAVASSASAQSVTEPRGEEFLMNAWTNPDVCNRNVARQISFSVLADHAKKFSGECVAVEGYWSGRALFAAKGDAAARHSNTSERFKRKRIGLYARWETIGAPPEQPPRTTFVGRVGQCETQWPDVVMVMGSCHYTDGPILLVAEVIPR